MRRFLVGGCEDELELEGRAANGDGGVSVKLMFGLRLCRGSDPVVWERASEWSLAWLLE